MSLRTFVHAVLITLSLLLPACSAKKPEKPKGRPPALVVVAAAAQRDVPVQLKAIGTMEASESVTIKTQLSGELTRVLFKEGQDVQKGALLCQLDPRSYLAAQRKAEAALARDRVVMENAKKNYERYRQLVKDGIVTLEQAEGYRTTADSAAASVAVDQAEMENTRTQLSYCTIRAPISGRLGVLAINQGNVVKANDSALMTINKITPIFATFTIPEKEMPAVKRQMAGGRLVVEAELTGTAGFKEKGIVSFIDNSVDPTTGTIRLKATFDNAKRQLWPGQFINLSIIMAVKSNAVVIPTQAVQTGQKGQFVFVVKPDATAEIRPVTVGTVFQELTVIENGIRPGEQVVIDGQMRVIPGAKVEIKQPDKPLAAKAATTAAAPAAPKPAEKGAAGK